MNVLFLTIAPLNRITDRGIYTDLLRKFRDMGHNVTIVSPVERRSKLKTNFKEIDHVKQLHVRTFNITKSHFIEKGIATIAIEYQYLKAIKKYLSEIKFDLVLFSTPPITFEKVICYIKSRDNAFAYLLLKDIFPQNAVDMDMIKKGSLIHKFFERKEKRLYAISDTIGCMSPANVNFIIKNNPDVIKGQIEENPNTINPKYIYYTNEEIKETRKKYLLPIDKTIFVYGGNLGIAQGLEFLITTIQKIHIPEVHFLIVGNGTQFIKIEKWFTSHKPNNATLIAGLPKNEYDSLLAACDVGMIFLHKSFTIPNFPSRLLSYLEMKKPVLAATDNITDIGEVIEEARCGYWVESGNIKSMKNRVTQLCNEDLLKKGENGWNLLQCKYLVDRSYNLIVEKINV